MSIICRLAKEGSSYTVLASADMPWKGKGLMLTDYMSVQQGIPDTQTRPRAVAHGLQRGPLQYHVETELQQGSGPGAGRSRRARPSSLGELHGDYKVAASGVAPNSEAPDETEPTRRAEQDLQFRVIDEDLLDYTPLGPVRHGL